MSPRGWAREAARAASGGAEARANKPNEGARGWAGETARSASSGAVSGGAEARASKPHEGARVMLVTAGTGPVEVRRFVARLAEYLVERCTERGAVVGEVVVRGDEEAPGSVEIHLVSASAEVDGLAGTHALIARSEDRGRKARKRWYAGVKLCGASGAGAGGGRVAPVERSEVTITAMRAGGPGGQHVNKTASAVRVVHRASGVTVRVSDERSQHDNVRVALVRLGKIVAERAAEAVAGARAGRRMEHYRVERGRPAFVYEMDRNGGILPCETTCSR